MFLCMCVCVCTQYSRSRLPTLTIVQAADWMNAYACYEEGQQLIG